MKYLVPPIVIPILLVIGIVAYAILKPPIIAVHPPLPAAKSDSIEPQVGRSEEPAGAMYHLPPPWVFAVVGSLLAFGSAVIGGFIAWKLEREEKALEGKQRTDTTNLARARDKYSEGIIHYSLYQLKLSLAQLVRPLQPQEDQLVEMLATDLLNQARYSAMYAIDARNQAAGYMLSIDNLSELFNWKDKDLHAAVEEISEIWDKLSHRYAADHNKEVARGDQSASQLNDIRRKIARSRYISVTLQVLGLLIVMGKDLPRP